MAIDEYVNNAVQALQKKGTRYTTRFSQAQSILQQIQDDVSANRISQDDAKQAMKTIQETASQVLNNTYVKRNHFKWNTGITENNLSAYAQEFHTQIGSFFDVANQYVQQNNSNIVRFTENNSQEEVLRTGTYDAPVVSRRPFRDSPPLTSILEHNLTQTTNRMPSISQQESHDTTDETPSSEDVNYTPARRRNTRNNNGGSRKSSKLRKFFLGGLLMAASFTAGYFANNASNQTPVVPQESSLTTVGTNTDEYTVTPSSLDSQLQDGNAFVQTIRPVYNTFFTRYQSDSGLVLGNQLPSQLETPQQFQALGRNISSAYPYTIGRLSQPIDKFEMDPQKRENISALTGLSKEKITQLYSLANYIQNTRGGM